MSYNIPFLSIMLTLVSGILVPLLRQGGLGAAAGPWGAAGGSGLSALLLARLSRGGGQLLLSHGAYPRPLGQRAAGRPSGGAAGPDLQRGDAALPQRRSGRICGRTSGRTGWGWYCLLMQLLFGALLAMVYTDDLFTGYVFVEIAAVTACVAVAAKESGRSVVAAIRYLIFSCLGSGLVLLGIAMLYCITGAAAVLRPGGGGGPAGPVGGVQPAPGGVRLLMTLGLSIKSAQFPFHAWLPDAHASATTASSAILSGLVLKGYLVLLLKLILRVFGPALIVSTYGRSSVFLLGLTGMLFASVAAPCGRRRSSV